MQTDVENIIKSSVSAHEGNKSETLADPKKTEPSRERESNLYESSILNVLHQECPNRRCFESRSLILVLSTCRDPIGSPSFLFNINSTLCISQSLFCFRLSSIFEKKKKNILLYLFFTGKKKKDTETALFLRQIRN